jgi:ABC-type protease/lipase transport system fused ATPase/permease subunit
MIAASILLGRALSPLDQAMASWRSLVQARGAYTRLQELLAEHPPQPARLALPRPRGQVVAEGLVVALRAAVSPSCAASASARHRVCWWA